MNKKKIVALLFAGIMTIGVIGGTFAWFTSNDSVTNVFSTGAVNDDGGNGVEIWEDYDPSDATNVVPGDKTTKLVQVQNTTKYHSFIRVKINKTWDTTTGKNDDGETITLNPDVIELNFGDNLGKEDGKWLQGVDGYYYYVGKVAGGKYTNPLLESVTFLSSLKNGESVVNTGNEYRNVKYNVEVVAESIQADNEAYKVWVEAGGDILGMLDSYKDKVANGNDDKHSDDVTITNSNVREANLKNSN